MNIGSTTKTETVEPCPLCVRELALNPSWKSNADWESPPDPDVKVARVKNGSTRFAYRPEHAVDLDIGMVVAAPIHLADCGDTNTLVPTLKAAARNLAGIGLMPTPDTACNLVTDRDYHSCEGLKRLAGGVWQTRISEAMPAKGLLR